MDALASILWLGCSILIGHAAWKVARIWFPGDSGAAMAMHTLVLSWGLVVVAAVLLGLANLLTAWLLLASTATVALVILLVLRIGFAGAGAANVDRASEPSVWRWFWLCVFVLGFAHVVTSGLLKFPTDWDTLHYHLPMIVHWLQAGSLYAPDSCLWSFPGNNEIVGLWMVAPFSGDFLIGLNNLFIAALLACAAIELGKTLGLSPSLAHATGFGVVCNFVVLNQLVDASNDLGVASLFLASMAYGMRVARTEQGLGNAILLGVALGLLVGVKFYALGYATIAACVSLALAWKAHGLRLAARLALLTIVGVLLFGGYWYARNYWVAGSALYPKAFDADVDLMGKIYPDIANTSFLGNGRPELGALAIEAVWQMSGPLHMAAFILAPLTIAWILISTCMKPFKNRVDTIDGRRALAFVLAGTAGVLLITPFAVEDAPGTLNQMHWYYCPVRYGMCFLTLSVVSLSIAIQDCVAGTPKLAWLPTGIVLIGAMSQVVFVNDRLSLERAEVLLISGNLLLVIGNIWIVAKLWPPMRWPISVAALIVGFAAAAWGVDRLAQRWHGGFAPFYDRRFSGGTFSELSRTEGAGPICVLHHRGYPYFGSRRQHRVCQPVYVPSSSWLMTYFKDRRVQFVATMPSVGVEGWHLFEHFDECLRSHPAEFQRMNAGRPVHVFEIVGHVQSAR